MPAKRWPTVQQLLDDLRHDILDETTGTVRPDRQSREAFYAEVDALKAKRAAEQAEIAQQSAPEDTPRSA